MSGPRTHALMMKSAMPAEHRRALSAVRLRKKARVLVTAMPAVAVPHCIPPMHVQHHRNSTAGILWEATVWNFTDATEGGLLMWTWTRVALWGVTAWRNMVMGQVLWRMAGMRRTRARL